MALAQAPRGAAGLVRAVPLLTVRPMLLAYIPDLLASGAQVRRSFELYEAMVDSWLERESRWVKKESLREFSEHLAMDLYCNRERRGAERIPTDELSRLAAQWAILLESWQLTGRSLLNRDAAGNYKFAHRSIMEFLFVRRYIEEDPLICQAAATDQMVTFLADAIGSGKWKALGGTSLSLKRTLTETQMLPTVKANWLPHDESDARFSVTIENRALFHIDLEKVSLIMLDGSRFSIGALPRRIQNKVTQRQIFKLTKDAIVIERLGMRPTEEAEVKK